MAGDNKETDKKEIGKKEIDKKEIDKKQANKKEAGSFLQKTIGVWFVALLCCALWGSAFPCVKIGYQMFAIEADQVAAQILFAGCRFTLAGILTILIGSILQKKILIPKKESWGNI